MRSSRLSNQSEASETRHAPSSRPSRRRRRSHPCPGSARDPRKGIAELRRKGDPALVIEGVLVLAEKHRFRRSAAGPLSTTLDHIQPQSNPRLPKQPQAVSWPSYAPRPVNTAAPQRAATASASSIGIRRARAYVRPAANASPAPGASTPGPAPPAESYRRARPYLPAPRPSGRRTATPGQVTDAQRLPVVVRARDEDVEYRP